MDPKEKPLREGETVLLYREGEKHILVNLSRGQKRIGSFGVLNLAPAIGMKEGSPLSLAGTSYILLRPTLMDLLSLWPRPTQIITPKDAQYLLYLGAVSPGSLVLEAGTGSGCLTLFLANAVGSYGRVVSYDRRREHQDVARVGLERAGLLDRVTFKAQDVRDGFEESNADSLFLDVPEPWELIQPSMEALRPGGCLTAYVPTYNQLEKTVRAMREGGLKEVRALELIERSLSVGEGGTRPDFEMLGHTGFLMGARKIRE